MVEVVGSSDRLWKRLVIELSALFRGKQHRCAGFDFGARWVRGLRLGPLLDALLTVVMALRAQI